MEDTVIPIQVKVHRSSKVKHRLVAASSVKIYDKALCEVFPYFMVGGPEKTKILTDALGEGFSEGEYGPFWPSFASVNDGRVGKVVWFSEAGLSCLRANLGNRYLFQVEEEVYG